MKNELTIFEHEQFGRLRITYQNGDPWFVAKDVCDVLGIQNVAVERFDIDDDEVHKMYIPELSNNYTLVSESGLYTLIIRSNKPEAKKFRKWVTSEVLSSIRKTGGYSLNGNAESVSEDFLVSSQKYISLLESNNSLLKYKIEQLEKQTQPKRVNLTPQEIKTIRKMAQQGYTVAEICATMKRSESSVRKFTGKFFID